MSKTAQVGLTGGVFLSNNEGNNWTMVNDGLNSYIIKSLVSYGTKIIAGTGCGGAYVLANNGSKWKAFNEGLYSIHISSLAVCGSYIFAGTEFGGVWKRPLGDLTSTPEAAVKQDDIRLYPNPCKGKFRIETDNITSDKLRLEIYNFYGAHILSVLNFNQATNEFDLTGFPDGVYFIKIFTGEEIYSKKLLKQ